MKVYIVLRNNIINNSILGVFKKIEDAKKDVERLVNEDRINREDYVDVSWTEEKFGFSNIKYRIEVFWKAEYEYDEETMIYEYFIKEFDVQ